MTMRSPELNCQAVSDDISCLKVVLIGILPLYMELPLCLSVTGLLYPQHLC
jgi:hypothetical protein